MLALSIKIHEERDCENLSYFKWIIEKPRGYWLLNKHCLDLLLPKFLPSPSLITDESKYYWHAYSNSWKCEKNVRRDLSNSLNLTLSRWLYNKHVSLKYILLSENLINVKQFEDVLSRKKFICNAKNFIRTQSVLEIACFEGLRLERIEGYELLSSLTASNKSLKFLFIWHLFKRNEYSQPKTTCWFFNGGATNRHNLSLHYHWLNAIENLQYLETISVNYAYVSSSTGDLLIHIARQLRGNWKLLQLLCLEEEIPETINCKGENNAVTIPDFAWNIARKYSPKLRVQIVLFGIPEYDQHKKFITQSIPVHTIVLSTNRELLFHKPCMLDCTLKTIYLWYHRHLVQLYLNLWNHREMFDQHLRKIFPCLPNLKIFEFLGGMKDTVTICTMCCQIKIGTCAVKHVTMQLQMHDNSSQDNWLSRINSFLDCFARDFDKLGVTFKIHSYPA